MPHRPGGQRPALQRWPGHPRRQHRPSRRTGAARDRPRPRTAGLASPHRGSGIGLSVVRLLIEAMGGLGQVAAHPGGGADFQLLLPEWANL